MAKAQGRVRVLYERCRNPDFALHAAGTLLAARARRSFDEQGHRGAKQWPARSVPNVLGILSDLEAGKIPDPKRYEPRPALVDSGALKASIRYQVRGNGVTLTANRPYASTHEKGGIVVKPITREALKGLAALLRQSPELRLSLGWLFTWARRGRPISKLIPARPFLEPSTRDMAEAAGAVRRAILAGGSA